MSEQTGLFSSGDVDVSVGGATDILGSVIGSSEGNVTVDTETLTHANLSDHNVYNDVGVSVTLSAGLWTPPKPAPVSGANGAAAGQNGEDQGGNPLCASIGGCTSPLREGVSQLLPHVHASTDVTKAKIRAIKHTKA